MAELNRRPGRDRVLLINMPWADVLEPNLGLGILKSVLRSHGIGCDVIEAPMRLLRYLKYDTYKWVAGFWAVNDFVFTREFERELSDEQRELLPKLAQDWQECLGSIGLLASNPAETVAKVLRLREEIVPRFLDDLVAGIDFSQYALVGLTCLFDQTIASLALAHRIKALHPEIMVAFGGYAVHKPVGPALQAAFPEMDVVAYGDGEPVIVPLWEAARGLRPLSEVPNISYRDRDGRVVESERTEKINLDDSPTPDYDDFFLQREEMRDRHQVDVPVTEIPVESSRGCWYGAKNHCTFCGIDDETLKYRVKSASVAIAQLDELHERYNLELFRFSDYIMPLRNFKDFLPELARRGAPYTLHYETKANLKEGQIELCAKAGIRFLQPGIESFSSPVLKLMDKGVSGAQNLYALSTMYRHGIRPFYNLIFGFPFEDPESYQAMIRLLPALYHLVPPISTVPVLVTRFAPLAEDPPRFGATGPMRAHWRYEAIFSQGFREAIGLSPDDFCYYYESPYRNFSPALKTVHEMLQHQVLKWIDRFNGGARLTFAEERDGLVITDTRASDEPRILRFGPAHKAMGELMRSQLHSGPRILEEMAERGFKQAEVERALDELSEARIVVSEGGHPVWLALDEGCLDRFSRVTAVRVHKNVRASSEWAERPLGRLLPVLPMLKVGLEVLAPQ